MKKSKAIARPRSQTALVIAHQIRADIVAVVRFCFERVPPFLAHCVLLPLLRTVVFIVGLIVRYGRWLLIAALCLAALPFVVVGVVCVVAVLLLALPVVLIVK